MSGVRPLEPDDLARLVALYGRVVRSHQVGVDAAREQHFGRLFLWNPWVDSEIPSLVHEDSHGRIIGFAGSQVRSLETEHGTIRMAHTGPALTDPGTQGDVVAASLLAEYLRGPQGLTVVECGGPGEQSDLVGLGAEPLHLSRLDWVRPLRPSTLGLGRIVDRRGRGIPRPLEFVSLAFDSAASRVPGAALRVERPDGSIERLTPTVLCEQLPGLARGYAVRPAYGTAFVAWLFREMAATTTRGTFTPSLVRAADGRILGWYIAYLRPGGISGVVQIVARNRDLGSVLDHLLFEAYEAGSAAVSGRTDPRLLPWLWGRQCVFRPSFGLFVHSRSPELLRIVHSGRGLVTRMDGEWWTRHRAAAERTRDRTGVARAAKVRLDVELVDDMASLKDVWMELAEEDGNIFSTWEWNSAWWDHLAQGRRLVLVVRRDRDGIAAIVPLYLWSERPLRVLRFLGHGQGDALGPICRGGDAEVVTDTLRRALAAVRFDVFVGDLVRSDQSWPSVLGGTVLRRTGYPILALSGRTWDEYVAAQSANARQIIRRHPRRLAAAHHVRFRLCDDPAQIGHDLDTLFSLHRLRFQQHEGCLFCGAAEGFQRSFAARALERGWLRLWILEVDGQPVAADYGFRFGGIEYYYQAGRDPSWDRWSVGRILKQHVIRTAFDDQLREYRFLEGDETYKYRYADGDPGLMTIAHAGTPAGKLAIAAATTLRRLPVAERFGRRSMH